MAEVSRFQVPIPLIFRVLQLLKALKPYISLVIQVQVKYVLIPHGFLPYIPRFFRHVFLSFPDLANSNHKSLQRRKNWIPLAALIVSNGPCNWAKSWDTVWGETTSNKGRMSCFFVCMNSGNFVSFTALEFYWRSGNWIMHITSHQNCLVKNFSINSWNAFQFCSFLLDRCSFQSLGLVENYQDCIKQIKLTVISWFSVGGFIILHEAGGELSSGQGQSQQCWYCRELLFFESWAINICSKLFLFNSRS